MSGFAQALPRRRARIRRRWPSDRTIYQRLFAAVILINVAHCVVNFVTKDLYLKVLSAVVLAIYVWLYHVTMKLHDWWAKREEDGRPIIAVTKPEWALLAGLWAISLELFLTW